MDSNDEQILEDIIQHLSSNEIHFYEGCFCKKPIVILAFKNRIEYQFYDPKNNVKNRPADAIYIRKMHGGWVVGYCQTCDLSHPDINVIDPDTKGSVPFNCKYIHTSKFTIIDLLNKFFTKE